LQQLSSMRNIKLLSIAGIFFAAYFYSKNIYSKNISIKKTSENGIDFIKRHEGWRAQLYLDAAGLATIGYGHLIKQGEDYFLIDKSEGERILKADLKIAESAVNEFVKVDLTQGMFDSLVSFVFNLGVGAFKRSTLLNVLNAGDYESASNELLRWNRAGGEVHQGLVNRRQAERNLFLA